MKKIISAALAAVLTFSVLTVTAFAAPNILDTLKKTLTSGKTTTFAVSSDYESDYTVKLSENGDLKIDLSGNYYKVVVSLYDSKGKAVSMTKRTATIGSWNGNGKDNELIYNGSSKKSDGVIEYDKLKKGTYYIRFFRYAWQEGTKLTVKATFPEAASTKIKGITLQLTLKNGGTLELEPLLSPADGAGTVTWKSDKPSVATVSATGKIKAVSKGTAVITCSSGKVSAKISIKVV